ncbi:MAG: hypothetical protein RL117_1566 [Verrucomicrobiota bacterium]|jgi:hypothetical protein
MDAFARLRLPHDLSFDESQLREAYRQMSKELQAAQPDESAQASLTAAYQLLLSPASRLRHWLEKQGHSGSDRGAIDGELLDSFTKVAQVLQSTDELLRRREQCQTALAKALMENALQQGRMQVENCQAELQELLRTKIALFPHITAGTLSPEQAWCCVRDLSFIEKWQRQLRERYGKFFF